MAENKAKKSKRPKKNVPTEWISDACQCTQAMVRMVVKGKRNANTELGENILVVERLLDEGVNNLLDEVKRIIQL